MLTGNRIYLRLTEPDDAQQRAEWMNDPVIRKYLNTPYPVSTHSTKNWIKKSVEDPTKTDFAICLNSSDKMIGYTGFRNIDLKNNKAESYTGIGIKDYWGEGYAKESKTLALDYIFNRYNLNKVYAKIRSDHQESINLNLSIGYLIEGTLRQDIFSNGRYFDMIIMSLLRDDYFIKKKPE